MRRIPGELGSLLLLALLAAPAGAQPPAPASGVEEEQAAALKAAFVLNFVRYTEWPKESFHGDDDPIEVCVLGDERMAAALESLVERAAPIAGRPVRVHPVIVERIDDPAPLVEELWSYEVLFVGEEVTREETRAVLADLGSAPLLTVGEGEGFVTAGGMLALVPKEKRFVFDANREAIAHSPITISARVLKLARAVEGTADR